jgi:glycosyltransferase involved in cell wall biosynthesis
MTPWPRAEQLAGETDVVHATGLLVPPTRRPLVVTVHDIAAILHPGLHPPRHGRLVREVITALPRAAAVVTVSRTTADELARLGIDPRRLLIAPLGLTPLPPPAPAPPGTPAPGTYLLTVGESSPRKGYDVLLQALGQDNTGISLVIAGPPASDEARLQSLAAQLGLGSRVVRLRTVSDSELACLYAGAIALCFPSIAEGFGLPVLEAMGAGLPVIASDIPITRELADDAAVFVDRSEPGAWKEAIREVTSQRGLRRELSNAGKRRARRFTWERTAALTEEAYEQAYRRSLRGRVVDRRSAPASIS